MQGYFDREISFNNKLFKNDFDFILNNRVSIHERSYNFKNKTIKNFLKRRNNIEFIIVEGIFSKQFSLQKKRYYRYFPRNWPRPKKLCNYKPRYSIQINRIQTRRI